MLFPVDETSLGQVIDAALSRGGHYADLFFEQTEACSLELQDGTVSQATQVTMYGMGVRTLCDDRTGYAYTMDLSLPQMLRAARNAACIADGQSASPYVPSPCRPLTASCYQQQKSWEEIPVEQQKQALLYIDQQARSLDARVIRVRAILNHQLRQTMFHNSLGEHFADSHPRASLVVVVVMQQETEVQMGYSTMSFSMGAEFLSEERLDEAVREAVERTRILFDATKPEGGEMPVVLAAGASGIFMHEALGHAFEADFVRKGTSIFAGRLGERICSPDITIVDDGTLPADVGAVNWDDEGVPGQRTVLVDHGRLNSFLHDRISARHFGVEPTGNGRRESFRHIPLPRMRSTYMLSGNSDEEEIIRSVKKGIYAKQFTNGQVQIGAGDFTFYMKQGYLIEDGHLTQPIRDVNIIGNGPQALADISMVADNLIIDHASGMCGKGGQSVPVSQGLPTVLVRKLTVGGV